MRQDAIERAVEHVRGRDIICSFSGGKDSLICLDLCKRFARRVEAFAMELVPGLRCFDEAIARGEAFFDIKVRRYPHWLRGEFARNGVYRFHASDGDVPSYEINDLYDLVRNEVGIERIVTGAKRGDSLWRRRTGALKFAGEWVKAPLWDWSNRDVAAYIKVRRLPIPVSDGRQASGVDLTLESVLHIHDHFPDDFLRLQAAYPFVGAIVKRREWYGVGAPEKRDRGTVPLAEQARRARLKGTMGGDGNRQALS